MADETLLGIDIGTSAVKAMLFDQTGVVLSQYSKAYKTYHTRHGFVEQNPELWLRLVDGAFSHIKSELDLSGLKAIGLTSQVNTHVFVDSNGTALAPAIVWQDGRCDAEANELNQRISEDARMKWWGEL
ncbi:MAG: hypothetical protein GY789_08340, partial [Hyphomicrobiales bacterium]|nr:hypothetical protein [Hyphomicrobiales bacterium]